LASYHFPKTNKQHLLFYPSDHFNVSSKTLLRQGFLTIPNDADW